jgi:acetate---CoA ligase (ADP-forming)
MKKGGLMESLQQLDAIFKPRSVALIGASAKPGKLGYDILYNLIHAGFSGPIYPVNPKADQLLGLDVYKSIGDIPQPPDLAVVIVPAKAVPDTLAQCGEAGIKAAIVVTGGFAEAGAEGEKLQEEMAVVARQYGMRVVGPNCQGVNNPHHQLCASWPLFTTKGGMAFISQSGTVGAALVDWAGQDQLGVSVFLSLGNRVDVDEADAIAYFNEDPHTRVIALYVEGVRRPKAFLEALAASKKPVVILKSGRTTRGRAAAESHTKSLAGNDAVYGAIFERYKVHRADTIEELYDFAKALAYMEKPTGRRLLNISSSGGAAILAIDEAEKLGFQNPAPSEELKNRLRAFLPDHCGVSNPIDLTGDAISDPGLYSKVIEASRSEYDAMVIIFGDPIHGASDHVTGKGELVIFCGGADVEREESRLIQQKGIPVYFSPERGMKALYQFFRFDQDSSGGAAETPPIDAMDHASGLIPMEEAVALLNKYGIPAVDAMPAASAREAASLAKKWGAPVAMKINSPDVSHKSDVGGVRLNVKSQTDVREAFKAIVTAVKKKVPSARIEGVSLSPMAAPGGVEVILGVVRDSQYGHVLMFGLGGIFTEIFKDVQFCLLPAKEEEFMRMIRGIRGYPILAGVRGQKAKDEKALMAVMKALSTLVTEHPEIDQIDLNPVLVYEKGLSVVDVRIYSR